MLRPYDLLENVLIEIEKGIREGINLNTLAEKYSLSVRHLQRLFKFAFNRTLGSYIYSRRLAASLDDMVKTDSNILDIALNYGYAYEQSYINAFKREFGVTPGDLRKSGHIVKVQPPLHLFDENRLSDGLLFGPDIVMVPQFHVIGKKHKLSNRDALPMASFLSAQFCFYERQNIPTAINSGVLMEISSEAEKDVDYRYFMPSVQVRTYDGIPKGFDYYTFPTSLCARFRFISRTSYEELNMHIADEMYQAIDNFMDSEDQKYFLERKRLRFNKFDSSVIHENYSLWEWFAPVVDKTAMEIPTFKPSGIKSVYKQELPTLRFIGKKCNVTPEPKNVLNLLYTWQLNSCFSDIEKQSGIDYKAFFDGGDAYISLVREKDGSIEHWMGMFMPVGTEVPEGYEALDFPKMKIGVCCLYGKRDEIVGYEVKPREKLKEDGFALRNVQWYFRRFNWCGFYKEDIYGKYLLDYCYPVES